MRVLLQTYAYAPLWGGVQRSVQQLQQFLAPRIEAAHIATSSHVELDPQNRFRFPFKGAFEGARFPFLSPEEPEWRKLFAFSPYLTYLLHFRPHIVHLHFLNVDAYYTLWAKDYLDFKIVTTCRGSDIHQHFQRSQTKQAFRERILQESDVTTTVSHELNARVKEITGRSAEVIPNSVEPAEKKGAGKKTRFFFAGRLNAQKDPLTLVRAFQELTTERAELVICGGGELEQEIRALARSGGTQERVSLLGELAPEIYRQELRSATALVMPSSRGEGCPNAVLEAMSCGIPVIGSRVGGIPELIEEGMTGLLFEPGNDPELATCLQWISDNPAGASEMGRRGREVAESRFHPEVIGRRYLNLYQDLIGISRQPD